jgi:UPF0755 protein
VPVHIDEGWGVRDIANELSDRGVIGSPLVFEAYAKIKGTSDFQAGNYEFRRHLGVRGAISVLQKGPKVRTVDLKIIPGQRLSEIADQVERQVPWLDGPTFLRLAQSGKVQSLVNSPSGSLEGLLWPDTYRVSDNETELDVLKTMSNEFGQKAAGLLDQPLPPGMTPYDVVKVASLIQSEAKLDKDRPLIASVIYNRLRKGMPLEIDASVLYALHKRQGLTATDLGVASPYNTYKVKGLPPTPIAGITLPSLEAAVHPASTPYLYYVIGGKDGHHVFATTYAQQQANVEAARRAGLL